MSNNNPPNSVYAIVATYNSNVEMLTQQYDSLYPQVEHIVYVDNGSENIELLKSLFFEKAGNRQCHVIYNAENMGLGHAQNQGIKYAKKNGATHILLFDHDSVPESGFTEGLLNAEAALKTKGVRVGAVGPVYYNNGSGEIYPATKFVGPFLKNVKLKDERIEVSYLIASGCLIPISVLNIVGEMDEILFIGGIDVEWSFRAQKYGFKIFVATVAKMNHVVGDKRLSIGIRKISLHSPQRWYYGYRCIIYLMRKKYVPIGYKIREITLGVIRVIIFFSISSKRFLYIKYCIQGVLDGFKLTSK
jgi:rhamnosyltransferase